MKIDSQGLEYSYIVSKLELVIKSRGVSGYTRIRAPLASAGRVLVRRRVSTIGKNRGSVGTCSRAEAGLERFAAARSMSGRNKCARDSLALAPVFLFLDAFAIGFDNAARLSTAGSFADREASTSEIRVRDTRLASLARSLVHRFRDVTRAPEAERPF